MADPTPDAELELEFQTGGFLHFLLSLLGPLLKSEKPEAGRLTADRLVKRTATQTFELPLDQVELVYRNTTSDSFACVGRDPSQSLLFPMVANADAFAAALRARGVGVEEESTSPRRRFLR